MAVWLCVPVLRPLLAGELLTRADALLLPLMLTVAHMLCVPVDRPVTALEPELELLPVEVEEKL